MPKLYVKCQRCSTPYMMMLGSINLHDPIFVCIDCVEAITPFELLNYFLPLLTKFKQSKNSL